MGRHWTLTLVGFANVAAGFALFAVGSTTLAGVVTASGAYGLFIPEVFETPDHTAGATRYAPAETE